MNRIMITLLAVVILVTACSKNANHQPAINTTDNSSVSATGTITGMDGRKCACCWGWLITIDGKEYKFDKIPEGSSFDLNNINYPANVNIEWKDAAGDCSGKLIEVLSISCL